MRSFFLTAASFGSRIILACLAFLPALAALPSVADEFDSERGALAKLQKEYAVSPADIAGVLVPVMSERRGERVLSRWEKPIVSVAVIGGPGVPTKFVSYFSEGFSFVGDIAGRRFDVCNENVASSDGRALQPEKGQADCLEKPRDILVVIDGSVNQSGSTMEAAFRVWAPKSGMLRSFWTKQLADLRTDGSATGCGAALDTDRKTDALVLGAAYLRVGGLEKADIDKVNQCLDLVPYNLLGSLPITKEDKFIFLPELLKLLYSRRLTVGMSQGEIVTVLRQ